MPGSGEDRPSLDQGDGLPGLNGQRPSHLMALMSHRRWKLPVSAFHLNHGPDGVLAQYSVSVEGSTAPEHLRQNREICGGRHQPVAAVGERRPQGIAITPFGEMVLARARAVLPTIDETPAPSTLRILISFLRFSTVSKDRQNKPMPDIVIVIAAANIIIFFHFSSDS